MTTPMGPATTATTTTTTTDRDHRDRVALLRLASAGVAVGCLAGIVAAAVEGTVTVASSVGAAGFVVALATFASARTQTTAASAAFTALVTTLVTLVSATYGNRYAGTASLYLLCVMLAGLLLSLRAAVVTCVVSVAADVTLFVLDKGHHLPDVEPTPIKRVSAIAVSVVVATLVFTTALRRLRAARDDADKKAAELSAMKESLERTVDERTRSLLEAKDAALAGSRAKTAFLANVSHELRTPLNAIVGITGLLRERERPHDEQELLTTVAQSTDALLALLNDVLDLSRLEAGRLRLSVQPCAPRAVVDDVVRLLRPEADRAGVTVVVDVAASVADRVSTDPTRLRQVLLNLLGNAIKFSNNGGRVDVVVAAVGDIVEFVVKDEGKGVAPELQARLFEPFEQGDSSTTRSTGGAGLGLAICRQLVGLLGGAISVDSAAGAGARFRFTITAPPTQEAPQPSSPSSSSALSVPNASSLSVLVVEDNPVNRAVLELMLARLGIQPHSVEGGRAALDWLGAHDADVVLLDVQMPELDGLEVARRVKASTTKKHPKLIAVTAHALPEEEERARAAGVDDYLTKPVRLEVLTEALRRALA